MSYLYFTFYKNVISKLFSTIVHTSKIPQQIEHLLKEQEQMVNLLLFSMDNQ